MSHKNVVGALLNYRCTLLLKSGRILLLITYVADNIWRKT